MAKFELLINQDIVVTHEVVVETDLGECELDKVLDEIDNKYDSIADYIEAMTTRGLKIISFEAEYQEYLRRLNAEEMEEIEEED